MSSHVKPAIRFFIIYLGAFVALGAIGGIIVPYAAIFYGVILSLPDISYDENLISLFFFFLYTSVPLGLTIGFFIGTLVSSASTIQLFRAKIMSSKKIKQSSLIYAIVVFIPAILLLHNSVSKYSVSAVEIFSSLTVIAGCYVSLYTYMLNNKMMRSFSKKIFSSG